MEFKKKPQSSVPAAKLPKSVSQAVKPAVPVQRLSVERLSVQRAIQEHTSRPVTVQRQVVQPALRAADLHTQENKRLAVQREALQREAAALGPISPEAMTQAIQRQQQEAPPVPMKPQSVGDWVTVMRFQAEQAQGRMMQTREAMQYTALQRQVANTIAQNFRQDRQPASERHQQYAGHLATLQRSPASAPVAAVALQLMPAGERPAVQRALDEVLQREAEQQAQDVQALKLHSLQRQLDELEQEATRPVMQRIQQRRGSGNPLPEAVQRHLEQGLNHDLSAVRIHDDQEADKMAQKVNAVAFTTGQDIYFRAGKFNPNSQSGLELLAHEVTHTVQQARGEVGPGIDPSASHEAQAREMGRKAARNPVNWTAKAGKLPVRSAPLTMGHAVQRQVGKNGDDGLKRLYDLINRKNVTVDPNTPHWTNSESAKLAMQLGLLKGEARQQKAQGLLKDFKVKYADGYKNVIMDAAKEFGVPPDAVFAIVMNEVGGDPPSLDTAALLGRAGNATAVGRTSVGDISMQIRTAEELLGFKQPQSFSKRMEIARAISNNRGGIYLAAAQVQKIISTHYSDRKDKAGFSVPELQRIITRYARGNGLSETSLTKDLWYGKQGKANLELLKKYQKQKSGDTKKTGNTPAEKNSAKTKEPQVKTKKEQKDKSVLTQVKQEKSKTKEDKQEKKEAKSGTEKSTAKKKQRDEMYTS